MYSQKCASLRTMLLGEVGRDAGHVQPGEQALQKREHAPAGKGGKYPPRPWNWKK